MASFLTPTHPWEETDETDDPESFAERAAELMRAVATGEVDLPRGESEALRKNAAQLYADLAGEEPAAANTERIVTASSEHGERSFITPKSYHED